MNLHNLRNEIATIRKTLRQDKRELKTLPEGELRILKRRNNQYYFQYYKRNYRGITKNKPLVHQLMRKAFLVERVRRNQSNLHILVPLEKALKPTDTTTLLDALITEYPYLNQEGCLCSEEAKAWLDDRYEQNSSHKERLIHFTGRGTAMRSKEEKEIGNILEAKNIAYRYEWVQYFNGHMYAPDFAILRESDEKIIYWEHFGMMNQASYREAAFKKILYYESCGLHLWENFIITFPNSKGALGTTGIHKICEVFLR